jgi:hypothetical protein
LTAPALTSLSSALSDTFVSLRARNFRLIVDYGYSAASNVLPLVLGPLGWS